MAHTFSHRHLRCRCRLHRHLHRHFNRFIHASMMHSRWRNNRRIFEHGMELNWSTVQTSSETIVLYVLSCFEWRYNVNGSWLHAYIRIDTCIDTWSVDAGVDAPENVWGGAGEARRINQDKTDRERERKGKKEEKEQGAKKQRRRKQKQQTETIIFVAFPV